MKKDRKKEILLSLSAPIPMPAPAAFFYAAALSCLFIYFFSCSYAAAPAYAETEETQTISESSRLTDSERRIAELSYKTSKPSKIRSVSITPPPGIQPYMRAERIEILSSEFDTEDQTYWLSSGIFTLSDTAETTVCEFEPVEAQYIKIRILKCRGDEIYSNLGKVNIGLNTFKLAGVITDFEDASPAAGAEVYINGEKSAVSNKNGDFMIEQCQYGSIEISIRASGYHDIKETAAVFTGKKISMAFRIKKHSYTLCGRVSGAEDSNPIALAGIKLVAAGYRAVETPSAAPEAARTAEVEPLSRITDEFGCYYFESVQSGSYEISASAEDYCDLVKSVYIDASKNYVINFIMKPIERPVEASDGGDEIEDEDKAEDEGEPH